MIEKNVKIIVELDTLPRSVAQGHPLYRQGYADGRTSRQSEVDRLTAKITELRSLLPNDKG